MLAEKTGGERSAILLDTGDALMILGDRDGAMQRFERALDAPDADRVQARLAIARLMVRYGKDGDARQQVALAFAESRIGEASPVTPDDLVEAANIFLSINDFDLAQRYFQKAKEAGAADEVVAIGLANVALVRGKRSDAQVATSVDRRSRGRSSRTTTISSRWAACTASSTTAYAP